MTRSREVDKIANTLRTYEEDHTTNTIVREKIMIHPITVTIMMTMRIITAVAISEEEEEVFGRSI